MKSLRCSARGFSLMELLVASVVAAVAAALLAGAMVPANRSAAIRADQAIAVQLLASRLALLEDQLTADQPATGQFDAPLENYAWTLSLTPLPAPQTALVAATLAVERTEGTHLDVVTYRQAAQP